MTTLVFEMADINKLIEEIRTAKTFSVTPDQIMTRHAIRGALLNAEGQTEEEARKAGRVSFLILKIASTHLVPKCFSRTVMVYT
ncbi:hypothetical protein BANRA_05403 [Escherichia coli]|nr:hypothetical protein BANRA_05403 [Escherichia coli]